MALDHDIDDSKEDKDDYDDNLSQREQAIRNSEVRKRIDDLLEKKRLRELLDDSDNW